MIVLRAADRFVTTQPGITTSHCFSAGAHYDPANLSFGPVIGVDEHLVAVGAGFPEHAHRGVEIHSWVASGALRHRAGPDDVVVAAGSSLLQDAADGLRHVEENGGDSELRLIQTTVLAGAGAEVSVLSAGAAVSGEFVHLFAVSGEWSVGSESLSSGDSARCSGDVRVDGAGVAVLVVG